MTIEIEISPPHILHTSKAVRRDQRKSSESYMHRCAGDVVATWAASAFANLPVRVEREYVVACDGEGELVAWDGPSPTYERATQLGFRVIAVVDVALVSEDEQSVGIVEAVELVYTSWPSPYKIEQLGRHGICLRVVEASWVMRQTEQPEDFTRIGYIKA
jgi:hypothetical protein